MGTYIINDVTTISIEIIVLFYFSTDLDKCKGKFTLLKHMVIDTALKNINHSLISLIYITIKNSMWMSYRKSHFRLTVHTIPVHLILTLKLNPFYSLLKRVVKMTLFSRFDSYCKISSSNRLCWMFIYIIQKLVLITKNSLFFDRWMEWLHWRTHLVGWLHYQHVSIFEILR